MAVWFEKQGIIQCSIQKIWDAYDNLGEFYTELVRLMPGITSVELVEAGADFVVLRTNEGLIQRTDIKKSISNEVIQVEYDEEARGGRAVTVKSHCKDVFQRKDVLVKHTITLSNVSASGFLGFLYRNFGKTSMGNAFLNSYKLYFERGSAK